MSEALKVVKKMNPHTACDKGNHTYVVTAWENKGSRKTAIHMRCQNCLMPLDLEEIKSAEWSKANGINGA